MVDTSNELSVEEEKVLAVAAVVGNVSGSRFVSLCQVTCEDLGHIGSPVSVRVDFLREKGLISRHAFRFVGDDYDGVTVLDAERGIVLTPAGELKINTHPFAHV